MFVVYQGEDGVLHEGKRDSARAAAGGSGHPLRLWQPKVQVHGGPDSGRGGVDDTRLHTTSHHLPPTFTLVFKRY